MLNDRFHYQKIYARHLFITVLALMLVISGIPANIFASSPPVTLTGSGTENDPYLISTAQELNEVRNNLTAYYKLISDIDLSDYLAPDGDGYNDGNGWIPIGDSDNYFNGNFDGAGHSIKNLYINNDNAWWQGLFGYIYSSAEIHNLHLLDVDIIGNSNVGGLVGNSKGKITSCSISGSVEGSFWVGGLVGYNSSGSTISNSYSIASVTGGSYIGGLAGLLQPGTSITNSYAAGLVDGSGGLVGVNYGEVIDSFYDYEITEQYDEGNGEPKSTEDMMKQETFTNWDFTNTWKIIEGSSYPKLLWQSWTDEEAILLDLNLLTWDIIKGENVTESEVTKPLNLPTSGVNGTTIDWSVLPDEGWLNTSNGTITRPSNGQGDKNVTLTATVSKGAETSQTKTFTLTIKEAAALILQSITPVPDIEVPFGTSVDAAKAALAATTTIIDSNNQSHDVTLDWTFSNYDGNIAGNYSAVGTFTLPTGVGQTDPETALEVTATVTVQATSINTDATLSNLTLNGGTLNQPFAAHDTNYSSSVSNSVATITVTPTAADSKALIKVNGLLVDSGQISQPINLSVGSNTITILVTAENTEYTKIYTITVQRAAASGSGSGGSNDSDDSDGGTQPEETPLSANVEGMKAPAILESATGLIKVELGTTLLNKAFDAVTENINRNKQIKVELPKSATGRYNIGLPVASLSASKANQNIVIHSDIASVTITNTMLTCLGFENNENVSITVNNANKEVLPQEIKNAIGNRPVIQLGLIIDGEQQAWNNPNSPVTIAIPYKPSAEELKDPEHITIWYLDGAGKIVAVPSGRYDHATGLVTFTTTHFSNYAVVYVQKSFEDMNGSAWAKKSVEVLASKGIISGTSQTTFSPSANISRADYLVLLINTLGLTAQFESNFEDVKEGTYYYEAVGIAKQLGITLGVGNNRFNPKESISRQDMMVLTARALQKFKNLTVTDTDTVLMKFSDKGNIAKYAADSIAALIKEELIVGNGDKINPLANTTRAEAAVFLYRIYNKNY